MFPLHDGVSRWGLSVGFNPVSRWGLIVGFNPGFGCEPHCPGSGLFFPDLCRRPLPVPLRGEFSFGRGPGESVPRVRSVHLGSS